MKRGTWASIDQAHLDRRRKREILSSRMPMFGADAMDWEEPNWCRIIADRGGAVPVWNGGSLPVWPSARVERSRRGYRFELGCDASVSLDLYCMQMMLALFARAL